MKKGISVAHLLPRIILLNLKHQTFKLLALNEHKTKFLVQYKTIIESITANTETRNVVLIYSKSHLTPV